MPKDILSRGLAKRPLLEIWTEILPRGLLQRSCNRALSYRDLVQRSCQETSHGDLVQRLGEEGGGLARRSCRDTLNRDLTLRSLAKILLHKSPKEPCADSLSQRSCAAVFIERTCQGDLAYDLPQRSSHRELAESHLVSLLFPTRVALALLACSR